MSKAVLFKLIIVAIFWIIAGILITIHEYFFLSNYPGVLLTEPMKSYNFMNNLIAACFSLGMGGVIFGFFEMILFEKLYKRLRFWEAIFIKVFFYSLIIISLLSLTSWLYNSVLSGRSMFDTIAKQKTIAFMSSTAFWHPLLPFMVMVVISSFFMQLSERFSIQELTRMFSGQYFHPKEENRIFMFLDLNHSTTIAEKIGNEKFYQLLNDFFYDIAPVIEKNNGEVVEYIGDEIIVCWTIKDGVSGAGCINCFFDFEKKIKEKLPYYEEKYGLKPEFKAAIHSGNTIIGEIGKIKKSIKFSGDVLNTTSRVEGLCRTLGENFLVTQQVINHFNPFPYPLTKLQDAPLKGKEETVTIYKIK